MKRALVWIADGPNYAREVQENVKSFERVVPQLDRFFYTDQSGISGFTRTFPFVRQSDYFYLDSVRTMGQSLRDLQDYGQIMFLDTEVYCALDFTDIFDILHRVDLVGTHGMMRSTTPSLENIPRSFTELEIGAMAINNNDRVKAFFQGWYDLYVQNADFYGNNDQGPLREALWKSPGFQFYVTTPEYHCRWGWGVAVSGPVRLFHCRNMDQVEVARQINEKSGIRVWHPKTGLIGGWGGPCT